SCSDERAGPDRAPEHIVKEKTGVFHFVRPSHKGGIGAHNGHKTGEHDRLAPTFGIEGVCYFQVALLKEFSALLEYFQAHIVAHRIVGKIPQHRRDKEQCKEDVGVQGPGGTNGPGRKQKGVPRQEWGDHKTGFRKDDQEENEVGPQPIGGYYIYKVLVDMDDKINDKL